MGVMVVMVTDTAMEATGMVAMGATARGLLSPATAMAAMVMVMAMVGTVMVVTATATTRGLLSPATAMAATVMVTVMAMATAMATTVEHHTCYKTPHICDQLRVLNYVRNKKMYCRS